MCIKYKVLINFLLCVSWRMVNSTVPILLQNCRPNCRGGGGGHLYLRLDIILVKGLSKHTLNTYFSGMKIDPKYSFFLICVLCPFQNLSIWPKTYLFSNFARFCIPKRCMRVHYLVLKNNPNYVIFFYEDDIQPQIQVPPPQAKLLTIYFYHKSV